MENKKNENYFNEDFNKNQPEESKTKTKEDRIIGLLDKLKGMKIQENSENETKSEENQNDNVNSQSNIKL